MEPRRASHGHHGRHGGAGGGRGFQRFGGGRGRGGPAGRPATWFKGEGYNDFEVVSIAEEVVGISGFLSARVPGFSGVLKQRFSDFVVHEIAPSGRRVELRALCKKPKSGPAAFQELALAFVQGEKTEGDEGGRDGGKDRKKDAKPANADEVLVRVLTRKLAQKSGAINKQAHAAQERYNLRKLVELVGKEIGAKKGKEFEEFLAKVEEAREKFEAEQAVNGSSVTLAAAANSTSGANSALAAAAATEGLTFYIGGLNDKGDRVFIHESMRRYGSSRIVADTLNIGGDTSVIRIRPAFVTKHIPGERDARRDWPVGQPDYLQFTLYKRNKDTAVVLNQVAQSLKVPASLFSYADAKDKRGISTQLCTVYRVPKERAQLVLKPGTSRSLDDQPHLIGDLRYTAHKLQLGDCLGNHIAAAIRSLPNEENLPESQVRDAIASWESRGFINFHGLQRFGTTGPTSYHLIGRAMLRKDYKLAVLLLLRPQEGEASKIREAREHFRQHKDVAAALRMLPPFLAAERSILEGLQQNGVEAHELAFRNIPKPMRVSYVEAYQHYVWNEMASLRMSDKCDASAPMIGDLVLISSNAEEDGDEPPRKKHKRMMTKRVIKQEVLTLTAKNVGEFTMEDVVLPVPGHAILYPENMVGEAYRKMLATDGVDMRAHFEADGSQQYELDGYYRHVIKKPKNVSFELKQYVDATVSLIETDIDRLLRAKGERVVESTVNQGEKPSESDKRPAQRALVLEFELEYGSDATIALRELMKQSSSIHVNWQHTGSSDATAEAKNSSGPGNGDASVKPEGGKQAKKSKKPTAGKSEPRKVITAQKKTQVSIGRPGFSLGRS